MKKVFLILFLLSKNVNLFGQMDSLKLFFELVKSNELELNDSAIIEVSGLYSKAFMFEPIDQYNIPNLQLCPTKHDTIINSREIQFMGEIIPLDSNLFFVKYRYRQLNKFYTDTCTIVKFMNSFAAFPIDEFKPDEIVQALNDGNMRWYAAAFFPASTDDRQSAYVCKNKDGSYLIYGD